MRVLVKCPLLQRSMWPIKECKLMQAAIDMANVELKYGSYPPLLEMAHEIIASQGKELVEFKKILSEQYAVSA